MATIQRREPQVIRLSYTDSGTVVVTPDDEDRFVLTAQKAVQACQIHRQAEEAIRRFKNEFIRPLINWCRANSTRVRGCYIPVPVGHIQVFVVGESSKYDFDLGKEAAGLELQLADKGWQVNVLQIPYSEDEDLRTYFTIEGALQVYAQLEAASS